MDFVKKYMPMPSIAKLRNPTVLSSSQAKQGKTESDIEESYQDASQNPCNYLFHSSSAAESGKLSETTSDQMSMVSNLFRQTRCYRQTRFHCRIARF